MDKVEKFLIVVLIMTIIFGTMAVVSAFMDSSSSMMCKIAGYDGGEQLFWQGETVCYNEITPNQTAVKEYFYLDDGE